MSGGHLPGCRPLTIDLPDPSTQCSDCLRRTAWALGWAFADLIVWEALDRGDASTMTRAVRVNAERAVEVGTSIARDLGVDVETVT